MLIIHAGDSELVAVDCFESSKYYITKYEEIYTLRFELCECEEILV